MSEFSNPVDLQLDLGNYKSDFSSSSSSSIPSTMPMELLVDNSQLENPEDITTLRLQ